MSSTMRLLFTMTAVLLQRVRSNIQRGVSQGLPGAIDFYGTPRCDRGYRFADMGSNTPWCTYWNGGSECWGCTPCEAGKYKDHSHDWEQQCEQCREYGIYYPEHPGEYMPHTAAHSCRVCMQGWYAPSYGLKECEDVNECKKDHPDLDHTESWSEVEGKCHEHAFCNNSYGSYACICKPGYHGDGEASGLGCWGDWGVQTWDDGTNKWVTIEVATTKTSESHHYFPTFDASACATSGYSPVSHAECLSNAESAVGCHTEWKSSACRCAVGTTPSHYTFSGHAQNQGSDSDASEQLSYDQKKHPPQRDAAKQISIQICKVGSERKTSWKTAATYADNMLHFYKQSQNALTRMTDKMQITDSLWHKICEDAKAEAKAAISQFHNAIVQYSNSVTSFNEAMTLMKDDQTIMKSNEIKMNEAIQTWMGAQSARAQAHRRHFEFHTLLGLKFPRRENSWRPAKDFMKKEHNIGPRVWDGEQYVLPTNDHTHDIYRAFKGFRDGETMIAGRDPEKDDVKDWWHESA